MNGNLQNISSATFWFYLMNTALNTLLVLVSVKPVEGTRTDAAVKRLRTISGLEEVQVHPTNL